MKSELRAPPERKGGGRKSGGHNVKIKIGEKRNGGREWMRMRMRRRRRGSRIRKRVKKKDAKKGGSTYVRNTCVQIDLYLLNYVR